MLINILSYNGELLAPHYFCNLDEKLKVCYTYDAWGKCEVKGNLTLGDLNPFRYRGYYFDTETKLYYLQTRYYDPETGRFISRDNDKYLNTGYINGLNLYAYCKNNPVMHTDPNGTDAIYMVDFGLPVVGHAVVFVQDAAGNWYQTEYHGSGTVENHNLTDEYGVGTTKEDICEYIENHFSDRETKITYIKGNFEGSVHRLLTCGEEGYGEYNVLNNNCQHYVLDILREGKADNFGVNAYIHSLRAKINVIPVSFGANLGALTDLSNGEVTSNAPAAVGINTLMKTLYIGLSSPLITALPLWIMTAIAIFK